MILHAENSHTLIMERRKRNPTSKQLPILSRRGEKQSDDEEIKVTECRAVISSGTKETEGL